ncbi:MAG: sulfatase-like hydrolase/transferase [Clostridiaceae bacterium]|nr:sulfatase-like hydrolase/transferase [Clostridiaceae bacterium]
MSYNSLPNNLPNVLLILADQHRYDCVGYSNICHIRTPNLDKLAKEGVWFTNAYTPTPVCCPSRQSMLVGRRPETFGAFWNYTSGISVKSLSPDEYTWVKHIRENGYITAHIGKWNINPDYDPNYYGFDNYISDREYIDFRKEKYPEIKFSNGYFGEIDPVPVEDSHTHWLANKTIELIEQYDNKNKNSGDKSPWLISLNFTEPHLPCRPSEPFASMYNPSSIPMWPSFEENFENKPYIQRQQLLSWGIENFSWNDWAPIVSRYYGIISQMDDAIGRIMDKIDAMGLNDNTIIIYTTDHGDMCGSHRMMDKHYVLYDDIVKVPFIVRWPKKIKGGAKQENFICHSLDLPPTIIDIVELCKKVGTSGSGMSNSRVCDIEKQSNNNNNNNSSSNNNNGNNLKDRFQGRSLVPLLKSENVGNWRNFVVSTYNGQQFGLYSQRMIRTNNWKYIWNCTDIDELYNLDEDPYELNNLIKEADQNEKLNVMLKKLRMLLYEELLKDEDDLVVNNEWVKNQLVRQNKL